MKNFRLILSGLLLTAGFMTGFAAQVRIAMNAISSTMILNDQDGRQIDAGTPVNDTYTLELAPGKYTLTGIEKESVVNGSIVLDVKDTSEEQAFTIFTVQLYANSGWVYGTDYTIDVMVTTREGVRQEVTIGDCTKAVDPRKSVLAFSGNTIEVNYIPSEARKAEGYATSTQTATVTYNVALSGFCRQTTAHVVTLPADAGVEIGTKRSHFTDFSIVEPASTVVEGGVKKVTYQLVSGTKYNVRTWRKGGLTSAYYFTKSEGSSESQFTESTYSEYDPGQVNHDPKSNNGYETGDIFVNINERNHLVLNVGDTFDAHAMRTWELTDTQIDNYFFEPDFHYTVLDLDGNPSSRVIEVSTDATTSAWRTLKAVGNGTAIVLVTYDAIKVSRPDAGQQWMGGEYWGAIWPENTAAYVVTVGDASTSIQPNMVVNEKYNVGEDGKTLLKLAGINVDAEHDVFYYLDSEAGFEYTFTPAGVAEVTIAYPTIGKNAATYTGFGREGVTGNADGSYTLLLKQGRNIVRLTDAAGKSVFQVMIARPCHREITNVSREGFDKFYPGDKIKIQYTGLFHPANKLAGIYNMSAYVTYNGVPNGTSLILGSGQYTFGSAASAQAIEFTIPEDYDAAGNSEYVFGDGVIQVNGFGDPIGNHRNTDRQTGRYPNFTAVAHKTYFGSIPELRVPVSVPDVFNVTVACNVADAAVEIRQGDKVIEPDADGSYSCTPDTYTITVRADGYHVYLGQFVLTGEMDLDVTIDVQLEPCAGAWDGKSMTEPALADGVYQIGTGAELAWFANQVRTVDGNIDGALTDDIELNCWNWAPITKFAGHFNGNGHTIENLYIENGSAYSGLFGYVEGTDDKPARIERVTLTGRVYSKMGAGGIAGNIKNAEIDRCANMAYVEATNGLLNAGGITAFGGVNTVITNCVNGGQIVTTKKGAGIAAQPNASSCTINNCFNYGVYPANASNSNPCAGGINRSDILSNLFALETASAADGTFAKDGSEFVSADRLASGEIAWRLGEAFGQLIGGDAYPVIDGPKVFKVSYYLPAVDPESTEVLYTNGALPEEIGGEEAHWFADWDMTTSVATVDGDTTLYLTLGTLSGIEGIADGHDCSDAQWFNLQGVAVPRPEAGTHGVFIRVANGKSEKVVL